MRFFSFFCTTVFAVAISQGTLVRYPKNVYADHNEIVNLTWRVESYIKRGNCRLYDGQSEILTIKQSHSNFQNVLIFNQSYTNSSVSKIKFTIDQKMIVTYKMTDTVTKNFSLCTIVGIGVSDCDVINIFPEKKPFITPFPEQQFSFEEGSSPTLNFTLKYLGHKTLTPKWNFSFYPQRNSNNIHSVYGETFHSLEYQLPQLDRIMCQHWLTLDVYFNERILSTWKKQINVNFIPSMVEDVLFTKRGNCFTVSWCSNGQTGYCDLIYYVQFLNTMSEVVYIDTTNKTTATFCSVNLLQSVSVVVWATRNGRQGARSPPMHLTTDMKSAATDFLNENKTKSCTSKPPCYRNNPMRFKPEAELRIKPLYFYLLLGGCGFGCLVTVIVVVSCLFKKVVKCQSQRRRMRQRNEHFDREESSDVQSPPLYEPVGSIHENTVPPKPTGGYTPILPTYLSPYQTLQKETVYINVSN